MKKIYAVVLSALLSLSLAGCQQPEASTQKGPADSSLCANTSAYLMAETEEWVLLLHRQHSLLCRPGEPD